MRTVIVALLPATIFSVLMFGWPALFVIVTTILSCVVAEHLFLRLRKRATAVADYSAALTGLLLALTLPPYVPWWICVVGGVFAVVMGKQVSGGLGYNIFNPALIARVFLLISFPVQLTTWPEPHFFAGDQAYTLNQALAVFFAGDLTGGNPAVVLDTLSTATPLGQLRTELGLGKSVQQALGGTFDFGYIQASIGTIAGSLGETSVVLLLVGAAYMMRRRLFTWHVPGAMLAGCLLPAALFWIIDSSRYASPVFHLVTGGLVLGAFYMATDMVTSPVTRTGQLIFGAGCGLLTYVIRTWGGYPEGVSFAIVIMNATVPLIDQYTRPAVYGKTGYRSTKG
jgi:electron transport complex protein RnfD